MFVPRCSFVAAFAAALLLPGLSAAQGSVRVVDPFTPGAYASVQAAIDAAASGDVVLLRANWSPEFVLDGKSLTIVGEPGFAAACSNPLVPAVSMGVASYHNVVRNVAAGGVVILRGLALRGLEVSNVLGEVWVEDCDVSGVAPAMRATGCARLVVTGSQLHGPNGFTSQYNSAQVGSGLELLNSNAAISASSVVGGNGQSFTVTILGTSWSQSGEDGLTVTGGTLSLLGCTLEGGDGGFGGVDSLGFCAGGGNGGSGLRLVAGSPAVELKDTTAAGGVGAPGPTSGCVFGGGGNGSDGAPISIASGAVTTLPGPAATLHVGSPVREGQSVDLQLTGPPGSSALVLLAIAPGLQHVGKLAGPLLVAPPPIVIPFGALPASGTLSLPALLPELGPGVQSVRVFLQGVMSGTSGPLQAGSGSVLVALDSAF